MTVMMKAYFENLCVGIKQVQAVGEGGRLSEKDSICEMLEGLAQQEEKGGKLV